MRCRASKVSFLFVFADLVTNQISVCLEIGRWGEIGEQDYKGAQGNFGGMIETFVIFTVVNVSQEYMYIKME